MMEQIIKIIFVILIVWISFGCTSLIIYEYFISEFSEKKYNFCFNHRLSIYIFLGLLSFSKKNRHKYICNKCF